MNTPYVFWHDASICACGEDDMSESSSIYKRLNALATLRYGPTMWSAFHDTVRAVLKLAWSAQTAQPAKVATWSADRPGEGQDDITAYFLCTHVFGGRIVCQRLEDRSMYYIVWEPNGKGVSPLDFCLMAGSRVSNIEATFFPREFIEYFCHSKELDFARRLALFTDRFEGALTELELEAAS